MNHFNLIFTDVVKKEVQIHSFTFDYPVSLIPFVENSILSLIKLSCQHHLNILESNVD